MTKAQILDYWQDLTPDQPLSPAPVPYKHTGSTYTEDGLRLTGSKDWIDSILSRLKDLLDFENSMTRLQLVYKESTDKETGEATGTYNCYVQVHERGREAKIANTIFGR